MYTIADYEKSKFTKQNIIETARNLFWKKGYNDTRWEDFADEANINPGLIHYYFKKKEALGWVIYREFTEDSSAICREILGTEENILLESILNTRLCWKWIDTSRKFSRFVYEVALLRIPIQATVDEDEYHIKELNEALNLGIESRDIKIINRICVSTENELILAYANNYEGITAEICADYDVSSSCRILGIDHHLVEELSQEANKILDRYDFSITKGFKLRYKKL